MGTTGGEVREGEKHGTVQQEKGAFREHSLLGWTAASENFQRDEVTSGQLGNDGCKGGGREDGKRDRHEEIRT